MAYSLWTPQDEKKLIDLRREGFTNSHIATTLKKSRYSIEHKSHELIKDKQLSNRRTEEPCIIPTEPPDYDNFIQLKQQDFISVSDLHLPFIKYNLFSDYLFPIAHKNKIKILAINGDFLDLQALSAFKTADHSRSGMEAEFMLAENFLTETLKHFNTIYLCTGNHEARSLKKSEGTIEYTRFSRLFHGEVGKRIQVSNHKYMVIGDWFICHPDSFRKLGGSCPHDLATIYLKNVISGHNHKFGVTIHSSGKFICIDQGCATDEKKHSYYMTGVSMCGKWQNGFTLVRNNKATAFNLDYTDWSVWL